GARGGEPRLAKPPVPVPEQVGEERRGKADVVVEVREEPHRGRRELFQRLPRRLRVELGRVLDDLRLRTEAREYRHLARERRAERVDRLDAKPRRERGLAQALEDALAHLRGRLPREGDGEDLLGLAHELEKPQVAPHEELRLSRARRRLHDERAARVERGLALARVLRRLLLPWRVPRLVGVHERAKTRAWPLRSTTSPARKTTGAFRPTAGASRWRSSTRGSTSRGCPGATRKRTPSPSASRGKCPC